MTCNICGGEIPAGATHCPTCGSPVSTGTGEAEQSVGVGAQTGSSSGNMYQMAGGNAEPSNPFGAMQAPQGAPSYAGSQGATGYNPGGGASGYNPAGGTSGYNPGDSTFDPYGTGSGPIVTTTVPKKSNTGILIAVIAVVLVAGGLIACFALGVFSGKNGVYKFSSMKFGEMEISVSDVSSLGALAGANVDLTSLQIEINGDKANINLMGKGGECDVKFEGSRVIFSSKEGGETFEGEYSSGKITISYSGYSFVFKK